MLQHYSLEFKVPIEVVSLYVEKWKPEAFQHGHNSHCLQVASATSDCSMAIEFLLQWLSYIHTHLEFKILKYKLKPAKRLNQATSYHTDQHSTSDKVF